MGRLRYRSFWNAETTRAVRHYLKVLLSSLTVLMIVPESVRDCSARPKTKPLLIKLIGGFYNPVDYCPQSPKHRFSEGECYIAPEAGAFYIYTAKVS